MGYYTEYLSTILKGPLATSIKERLEARKAINNLSASDKKIYVQIPQLVEKEHKITKTDVEEDKVIKELKLAAAKTYALAFNLSTMDMQILEAVNSLMEVMSKIHEFGINYAKESLIGEKVERLSKLFVVLMQKAIQKAKQEERWEYKYVMLIVNEAKPGRDHKQFMAVVKTMFQTLGRQSRLVKFPIKMEIGKERRDIMGINRLTARCKELLENAQKQTNNREEVLNRLIHELESIIQESAKDIEDAFYEAYLIKKRDFLLVLKIMVNAEVLKGMNRRWVAMHFMPAKMAEGKDIKLDEIESKISKEFHTIAQALRISMVRLERLDTKVKRG